MQEHRLYRGQPKKYDDKPLSPSALRKDVIINLENLLSYQFGIKTDEYKRKCQMPHIKPQQYDCCASEAFYAFWLSLVNCVTKYNNYIINTAPENNPFKYQFFVCPPHYTDGKRIPLYKDGKYHNVYEQNGKMIPMGMNGVSSPEEIAEGCFEFAESFFNPNNLIEPLHCILSDYALFQHYNLMASEGYEKLYKIAFGELENSCEKIVFPTLALDWTWKQEKAIEFANVSGNKGTVMSISFEKYREWSRNERPDVIEIKGYCDDHGHQLPPQESRTPVLGLETYRDTDNFDNETPTRWGSENNKWMIEQKGAVIFWPWDYTIDKLLEQNKNKNGLGWFLDFKLEQNGCEETVTDTQII